MLSHVIALDRYAPDRDFSRRYRLDCKAPLLDYGTEGQRLDESCK